MLRRSIKQTKSLCHKKTRFRIRTYIMLIHLKQNKTDWDNRCITKVVIAYFNDEKYKYIDLLRFAYVL